MFKKWKKIKDEPITWGTYAALCAISLVISIPMYIYALAEAIYLDGMEGLIDDIKDKFKK